MPNVVIRSAERTDLPHVIELAAKSMAYSQSPYRDTPLKAAEEYRRNDLRHLERLFGQPNFNVFVAIENEQLVGHVMVFTGTEESVSGEEQGWIIDLSVIPSHWGKGIARELEERAEAFVRDKGIRYVGLAVTTANERAVKFYERMGFKEERKKMVKVLEKS